MLTRLLVLLVLGAPSLGAAQTQSSAAAESAIRDRYAGLAEALNRRDDAAVASYFTTDGDEVFLDRQRQVGRSAIGTSAKNDLAAWPPNRRISLKVTGVRMLSPEAALVETEATFSDGEMKSNRGTAVMVRQNGQWLIAALRVYPAAAGQ